MTDEYPGDERHFEPRQSPAAGTSDMIFIGEVTARQHDCILAALRYWQRTVLEGRNTNLVAGLPAEERSTATWSGDPLTADEIDDLCEEIN